MRVLSLLILSLACTCGPAQVLAQDAPVWKVDVNLDVRHEVNGVDSFQREKFIVIHANLLENEWDSPAQRASFLNDYDVYLGRDNGSQVWERNQSSEDPNRAGYPSMAALEARGQLARTNYANNAAAQALEHRAQSNMVGGQMFMWPNTDTNPNRCCSDSSPWRYANSDALALFQAGFMKYFYGEGGTSGQPRPTMMEVVNEPFYQAGDFDATPREIAEWHNEVATQMDNLAPDVLVGGYTAAFPELERNDFQQWEDNWKMFCDVAGEKMDFYSVHLYDYGPPSNPDAVVYRSGSNVEAILDMIEQYSVLQEGSVKPWNISEYGYWSPGLDGTPYTKERDWHNLRSFSTMMLQLMERPDVMLKTVPFIVLKANWWSHPSGNKYPYRLMRQKSELAGDSGPQWVYTELLKFFELWKDVGGKRIDTRPTNLDLQTDAYVDGNVVYLILNNLTKDRKEVGLNVPLPPGINLVQIDAKHSHNATGIPVVEEMQFPTNTLKVELNPEATMVLKMTLSDEVDLSHTSSEKKHYAESYLQPIRANSPLTFNLSDISTGATGEAVLRLSIGRDRTESRRPTVSINGNELAVPDNYRGYDQSNRDRFFGTLEIPVPYDLLREDNRVEISFPDDGGHVSSVTLQTFDFTREIDRSDGLTSTRGRELTTAQLKLLPNPFTDRLYIQFAAELGPASLELFDVSGRLMITRSGMLNDQALELGELSSGAYVVRIVTAQGVATRKIIKR